MRVSLILSLVVFGGVSVFSQTPPPVADNASPQDRGLKDRALEMERVRREDKKGVVTGRSGEALAEIKFNEIKEDFEQIQVTQSAIVAAYQTAKTIDYKLITTGAEQIGRRGERLKTNLFPPVPQKEDKKKKDKEKDDPAEPKPDVRSVPGDMKTVIAEIDNTLAIFVSSAMFSSARVANVADHARAKADLEHVIALSKKLKELSAAQLGTTN